MKMKTLANNLKLMYQTYKMSICATQAFDVDKTHIVFHGMACVHKLVHEYINASNPLIWFIFVVPKGKPRSMLWIIAPH